MYDPKIARWTSFDPDKQFWSGYIGMGNNPVGYVDKDGKWVHIAIGAAIGGIGAGVKLAIEGKFDITSVHTWKKIGVGAGTGAMVAAVPASAGYFLGGAAAGTITVAGNLADQAVDLNHTGKDVFKASNYNFTDAAVDGLIGGVSFGAGNAIGKYLRGNAINKNWTGPLNRGFLTKQFYKYPQLSGVVGSTTADVAFTAAKLGVSSLLSSSLLNTLSKNAIMLPEVVVTATRLPSGVVSMSTAGKKSVWRAIANIFK